MKKLAKVTTAKMVFWVANGVVQLAKCAKTGRFIKRDAAQFIADNLAFLAAKAHAPSATFEQSLKAGKQFDQAVSDNAVLSITANMLGDSQVNVLSVRWALTSN